jgi:hypothetical protein
MKARTMGAAPARLAVVLPILAASVACLCIAFAAAGQWPGGCAVASLGVILLFHGRTRRAWPGPLFLGGTTAAAAAAALAGAPAWLVVPGAALALAAWDVADFRRFLASDGSARPAGDLQRRHFASLGRALALGLVPAGGALALGVQMPFVVMLLLVILDLGCLGWALMLLRK